MADRTVAKYKRLPIINQSDRMEIISSIKYVDMVTLMHNKSSIDICKKFQPDIFARGEDWDDREAREYMESIGKQVIYFPRTKNVSTTDTIKEIERRYEWRVWKPHESSI